MSENTKTPDSETPKAAKKPAEPKPATPSGVQLQPRRIGEVKRRRFRLALSFILLVIVPSIWGAVYYGKYASDRYVAGAGFVVRGFEGGNPGDLVSSFTGLTSSGSTTSDSYIIRRYLKSADLLLILEKQFDLQAHYSDAKIDVISRFDANLPFEDFVHYWERRIITTYDSTTGIVTFEVQAFDPETALQLATAVLDEANSLVNELSSQARQDSERFALEEVERAETRLFEAQVALRQFRSTTGTVNPVMSAQLDAELIATLESQLAGLKAQITALEETVAPGAQILLQLQRRASALQDQIDTRRAAIGTATSNTISADRLTQFEGLQIEQTFAQQRYASALSSLEQARIDADRQQRYLAVFSRPLPPQDAIYPQRLRNILLIFAASFVLWAIGTLITYAVRDHLR